MAIEQRTTPEQRAALRQRYAPEPVPTCAYCHRGPMVKIPPQPVDSPRYVHWGCPHDNYGTVTSAGEPEIVALLDDADALAGALAEVTAWRALVEDTDHRLKRINGEDGWITFYTLPAGIWHRFLAAARGADVAGIVAGLNPAKEGTE